MTIARAPVIVLAATLALLLAGALAWRHSPPAPAEPLTLAVAASAFAGPLWVADRQGFLAAEGLRATLKPYPTGKLCLEAMLRGEAEVATVAETPIMFAGLAGTRCGSSPISPPAPSTPSSPAPIEASASRATCAGGASGSAWAPPPTISSMPC